MESPEEAKEAVRDFLERGTMGQAGMEIVLEEMMEGVECSVLALTDGARIAVLPPAQDHKRVNDGDEGPNTGGMGAFAPTPTVDAELLRVIQEQILKPTVDGMAKDGMPFMGCLFAGLMLTANGPRVIEFNCRFGDPETQAIMPLLDCDLFSVLRSCVQGQLSEGAVKVLPKTSVVSVVMASAGYPGKYEVGHEILGLERARCVPGVSVFHAGTRAVGLGQSAEATPKAKNLTSLSRLVGGRSSTGVAARVETAGGRILAVTAAGHGLSEARERAYVAVRSISFQGAHFRQDIADPKDAPDALARPPRQPSTSTYLGAGVDLSMESVISKCILPLMQKTARPGCEQEQLSDSSLAGICNISSLGLKDPLLVSSTSSVGTKLKVAMAMERFDSVGVDLVALLANDVAARGAEPLFMMGQLAAPKLDAKQALEVNQGLANGCIEAGCALMGCKTAEMPGVFSASGFDISGFIVGAAELRAPSLPRLDAMSEGDVLIGLPSSGLHSNGFSLLRSLAEAAGIKYREAAPFDPTRTFGEVLLTPSRIYSHTVLALVKKNLIKGAAPITSGGLSGASRGSCPRRCRYYLTRYYII